MDSGELMTIVTRRSFISASAATLAATKLKAAAPDKLVYIGSTDNKDHGSGVHVALWSSQTGTLSNLRQAAPIISAGFLVASNIKGERFLFAGHQAAPNVGALSSYRIAPSGDLTLINTVTTPHFDMVHLALDHTQACLIAASYGSGKVLSVKIAPDGHISAPVTELQLTGHGPNVSRQTAPHAHGVAISPDNHFVLINDLGTDLIMVYKLNAATAELTPNDPPSFKGAPGSGPRHLIFHPNGKWAYCVNELDSTLTLLNWDAAKGVLTQAASFPTLPPDGDVANNRAGEVIIDKTGRILYSCNRGAVEDLLVYTIGPDGHLTLASRLPLNGKEARHFAISPDGGFFVVAEQFSNQVAIFTRDPQTGILKSTDHHYEAATPSCILFV
jgi:6-phosphogluconolactonase